MKISLYLYAISIISVIVLDIGWTFLIARSFYYKYIGFVISSTANITPGIIFYLIYAFGISLFVTLPLYKSGAPLGHVFLYGLVLGLIAYGTYDLTNNVTIKNWPAIVTVVDMAWGGFLTAVSSTLAVWIVRICM